MSESCSTSFTSNSSMDDNQSPKIRCTEKNELIFTSEAKYSIVLERILLQNQKLPDYLARIKLNKDGHFTCNIKPNISILDYLKRIIKYTKAEFSTLVISMIYFIRVCQKQIFINEYNIHRIMVISILMAYKYNEDCLFDNKYLALVSGISLKEMVLLEHELLEILNFELYVSNETFSQYKQYLSKDSLSSSN